jgi:hypothetical protein
MNLALKDITNINNPKNKQVSEITKHARISLTKKNKTRKKYSRIGREHEGKVTTVRAESTIVY